MEGSPIIDRKKVEELIEYSDKLKEIFGEYLDIEFAIKRRANIYTSDKANNNSKGLKTNYFRQQ